jgi:rare lipoprotein A (peptidoglycan hydrolase)
MIVTSTATGRSVKVKVLDRCEGSGCKELDLTRSAFSSIDDLNKVRDLKKKKKKKKKKMLPL